MNDFRQCKIHYKYAINMPPQTDTIDALVSKLATRRLSDLMSEKIQILISPVMYNKMGSMFVQPILDLDAKDTNAQVCYEYANELKIKSKYPCHFELSKHGVHVVYDVLLYTNNINIIDLTVVLRNYFKDLNIMYLDYVSSFRDTPIYRAGSRKEDYTVFPINRLLNFTDYDIGLRHMNEIMTSTAWEIYYRNMFDLYPISFKDFLNMFKSI